MGTLINLAGVSDFSAVPSAEYVVTLTDAEEKTPAGGGNAYIKLTMTITDEDATDANGSKQFRNVSMGEKSLPYLKRALMAFDADPEIFESPFDAEAEFKRLLGNKALATVGQKEYQGETVNEVTKIRPLDFSA